MPISVQTNISSLVAQKSLGRTNERLQQTLQRLSTGRRINVAADDAAGSAIATSLNAKVRSHTVAERNTLSAISMAQTAESALGEMSATVIRMRELAVQSANGDLTQTDRGYLDTEFQTLPQEIDRLSESTQFNGIGLLGGTKTSIAFQVGIVTGEEMAIGIGGATEDQAQFAIGLIDGMLQEISTTRSTYGANINRLERSYANSQNQRINLAAAESAIVDLDVAKETAALARSRVLVQAGTSVLSQANQAPA